MILPTEYRTYNVKSKIFDDSMELKRLGFLLIPDHVLPYEECRTFTLDKLSVARQDRNLIYFREIQEYKRRFTLKSPQILEQTFFIFHCNLIHF